MPAASQESMSAGSNNAVEQLVYAWTRNGVTGRDGFQVRACSAGFEGDVLATALRLCEYRTDRSSSSGSPVAFGWAQSGGVRYWFRRGADSPDPLGRTGPFCAHVLAAPENLVGPAAIVSTFSQPFWVTAEADVGASLVLQPLDVQPSAHMPESISEVHEQFLAAVLSAWASGRRLAVLCEPAVMLDISSTVVNRVPELFEGQTLITYQHAGAQVAFKIAGVVDRSAAAPDSVLVELGTPAGGEVAELAARLLAGDNEVSVSAALEAARSGRIIDPARLVGTYTVLSQLGSPEGPSRGDLLSILGSPEASHLLLRDSGGIAVMLGLLSQCDQDVWRAYVSASVAWHGDRREQLGSELFAHCDGAALAAVHRLSQQEFRLRVGFVLAAGNAVSAKGLDISTLPVEIVADMLAWCALQPWADAALRRAAANPVVVVSHDGIDYAVRGRVAATAVIAGDNSCTKLICGDNLVLAAAAAEASTTGQLIKFARHVAGVSADPASTWMQCCVPGASSQELVELAALAVRASSNVSAEQIVATAVENLATRRDVVWGPLAEAAGEVASNSVRDAQFERLSLSLPGELRAALERMRPDKVAEAWCAATGAPWGDLVDWATATTNLLSWLPGLQATDARELIFDKVARLLRTPEELLDAHEAVFGTTPSDAVCKRVLAATARTEYGSDPGSLGVGIRASVMAHERDRRRLPRAPSEAVLTAVRGSVDQLDQRSYEDLADALRNQRGAKWALRILEQEQ
jgi:hypothetical protein